MTYVNVILFIPSQFFYFFRTVYFQFTFSILFCTNFTKIEFITQIRYFGVGPISEISNFAPETNERSIQNGGFDFSVWEKKKWFDSMRKIAEIK